MKFALALVTVLTSANVFAAPIIGGIDQSHHNLFFTCTAEGRLGVRHIQTTSTNMSLPLAKGEALEKCHAYLRGAKCTLLSCRH